MSDLKTLTRLRLGLMLEGPLLHSRRLLVVLLRLYLCTDKKPLHRWLLLQLRQLLVVVVMVEPRFRPLGKLVVGGVMIGRWRVKPWVAGMLLP